MQLNLSQLVTAARAGVTMHDAFASVHVAECGPDDHQQRYHELRQALSLLVPGPPLSSKLRTLDSGDFVSFSNSKLFVAVATAALHRTRMDDNTVETLLHYDEPPFAHRLMSAALCQVTEPEHTLALLAACADEPHTPTLTIPQDDWEPLHRLVFSDEQVDPPTHVMSQLSTHLVGRYTAAMRRDVLLWPGQSDFLLAVIHAMLRTLAKRPVSLPPMSLTPNGEDNTSSWLNRLVGILAVKLQQAGVTDIAGAVSNAAAHVTQHPLQSFATTLIARSFSIAAAMEFVSCCSCDCMTPIDAIVSSCGSRGDLCKVCYEFVAVEFGKTPEDPESRRQHRRTLMNYQNIIDPGVIVKVMRSIDAAEGADEYDGRFHCPLNTKHPPFHTAKPLLGELRAVTCTQCSITWCADCGYAHHPNAATCEVVKDAKKHRQDHFDRLQRCAANSLLCFDELLINVKHQERDREAALAKHRDLLARQRKLLEQELEDIQRSKEQVIRVNEAELNWAGDKGWEPRVIGSRRCPHCGRQPIKRMSRCKYMKCGMNTDTPGDYQGGCRGDFVYTDPANLFQPYSTEEHDASSARISAAIAELDTFIAKHLASGATEPIPAPTLRDNWPDSRCSVCSKKLLGDLRLQCCSCTEPPYYVCVYCIRDGAHSKHALHTQSGHVLQLQTA